MPVIYVCIFVRACVFMCVCVYVCVFMCFIVHVSPLKEANIKCSVCLHVCYFGSVFTLKSLLKLL